MSSPSSPRPPARSLRVNISDLLNPVNPPSPDSAPLSVGRSLSSVSSPASSAHTPILPGVSSIVDSPRERHATAHLEIRSRFANTTDAAAQSKTTYSYASYGRQATLDTETRHVRRVNQDNSSFNLRSAEWMPSSSNADNFRPTLPPLQVAHNLKIEPWQSSPFSASPRELQYSKDTGDHIDIDKSEYSNVLNRPIHRPVSSSPADSQRGLPAAGFAVPHPSFTRAVISIPHSPYGRQDQGPQQADYSTHPAVLGSPPYSHPPPLVERLPIVRPVQFPTMSSPESSPKHEYNVSSVSFTMGVTETPASTLQSSERASARLAARGSNTPAPTATDESAFILQLRPDEPRENTGRRRKRTHSNADLNGQNGGALAPRSPSLSSSSSADSPGSVNDRTENDEASRPKKVRGKADMNSSSGDLMSATTQNRFAEAVNGSTRSSKKGKQKERSGASSSHGHANGHFQPFPAQATIPHGYGVAVVPVREGLPTLPVSFAPYPIPMHLHPMGPPVSYTTGQSQPFGVRLFPELQYARCMSARYKADPFPRCVSCTRRWAGDTCRFQNIRILLRDANKTLWAVGFQDLEAKAQGPPLIFPDQWNVPLEKRHVDRIMETVASSLLPHLRKERAHQHLPNVVRRQRETDVRATCDTCMTSLFSSSWMCRQCGREACEECYATIVRLTAEPAPTPNPTPNGKSKVPTSPADQRALKEKHAQANPFFLACNRKAEHGVHTFVPVTRFSKIELDGAVSGMARLVKVSGESWQSPESSSVEERHPFEATEMEVDSSQGPSSSSDASASFKRSGSETLEPSAGLVPEHYNDGICKLIGNPIPPRVGDAPSPALPSTSETPLETPTWPVPYYTAESLTEPVFAAQWARGTPLVVTSLLDRCKLSWTPEYFINTYGAQSCIVLECQTDGNKKVTVAEYFSCFGKYEGRTECWKLKDWPPSTDFRTAFPELYDDFNRAVPVPSYTRRDGAYNIASHFPTNTIAPDLGPKMYNAYASSDTPGSKGSTRLHMDMADAVNIMLHAESTADGAPGCAAWDIFRAEDSLALRQFLKKNFKGRYQNDPIHSQTFYLDPVLRAQLFKEWGVRSFRIYQRPGEAVFIPAGCAHQVCNLSDSIKAACDFVSPENVERCETLTREFRAQNQSLVWKEDVLQLRSMMWFAWLSCRRQQDQWAGQDSGLESAVAHATISNDEPDKGDMDTKQ